MNFMKYNIVIVLIAIIIASSSVADEAKSSSKQQQQQIQKSQNNVPLSSSVNDAKQQNKRLAYFAPSSTLSSGFKPITSSYPTVSNFVSNHHYQQPYTSGLGNSYVKYPYGSQQQQQHQQQFVSPSNVKFSSPLNAYSRPAPLSYGYHNNNNYQQLAFAASQPAAVSYIHSPYQLAQQIFTQQLPLHNYNVQQLSPFIHAPTMGYFGPYQTPVQSQFQQFGTLNKYPQISTFHQPQTYNVASQPSSPKHSQLITSKPVALKAPLPAHSSSNHGASPSTSSSSSSSSSSHSSSQSGEVHHNQHGAISYSTFLQPSDKSHPPLPTAAALIATQPPSHVYYHHNHNHHHQAPPQTFVDYSKHLSGAYSLPIAQNYYTGFNAAAQAHIAPAQSQAFQPYAHISKISVIPTPSVPTPQVVSVSVVPTIPQKISLH